MPASPAPITDPRDETGEIRIPLAKLCILRSDLSLEPPGPDWEAIKPNPNEHEVFNVIPDVISRSAGAGRIDAFTLRIDLGKNEEDRAHEFLHLPSYNRQYEIRARDDEDEPNIILAWGVEVQRTVDLGEHSESVHVTCRLDDFLFGQPLNSYPILDASGGTNYRRNIELPLVWNPEREINGTPVIEPNQSVFTDSNETGGTNHGWSFVLDPESGRTTASRQFQMTDGGTSYGTVAPLWSIAEAAYALCWWCNDEETWIANPAALADVQSQLGTLGDDRTLLKNQRQSYGHYLPKQLDELLTPHGFGWYLEHSAVDPDPVLDPPQKVRVSTIRFYRKGEGMPVSLLRAKEGTKTRLNTNVNHLRSQVSIVEMANVIQVYGAPERREATFELKKAWAAADDTLHAAELTIGKETYKTKPFVGRKWVYDTAGDYIDLRTSYTAPDDLTQYFDPAAWADNLTYLVGETVIRTGTCYLCLVENENSEPTNNAATPPVSTNPNWQVIDDPSGSLAFRRRVFLPCLSEKSRGDDGVSNRYVLEWFNPNAGLAAEAWDPETTYYRGQVAVQLGVVYKALEDNRNDEPPSANWEVVGAYLPPEWDDEVAYDTDDEVRYDGRRYRAINGPHTGSVPSSSPNDWTLIEPNFYGGDWVRFTGGFSVLHHECGILFETPEIPGQLWTLLQHDPPLDRLRITCSIEGDRRVQGRALRRTSSPNEQDVVLTLDMPDKFQDARIVRGSQFYGTANQHCRNDTAKILTYAQDVQEIEDCAQYSFSLLTEGMLHPELEIGMLVKSIDGIDVTLDANVRAPGRDPRYPQIVGLNYSTQRPQTCEVMLETFKQERPEVNQA